jgi:hypothetical protein
VARCHFKWRLLGGVWGSWGILKTRSNHCSDILKHMVAKKCWLGGSWEVKGSWGRELVTQLNCRWKNSKTKNLAFIGRELRYLKLFEGNPGDLKNHSPESSGTHSHSGHMGICH